MDLLAEAARRDGLRSGLNVGALLVGAIAAVLLKPLSAPWIAWIDTPGNAPGPVFVIVGLALAATTSGLAGSRAGRRSA